MILNENFMKETKKIKYKIDMLVICKIYQFIVLLG